MPATAISELRIAVKPSLSPAELDDAGALVSEAHWNQVAADWRLFVELGRVYAAHAASGRLVATSAILPYGERRYLFNVYLGASYPLSWRDLEDRFCSKDPAVRSRFLERVRARWILVRDPRAQDAAAAASGPEARMCGGSMTAPGAVLPAVSQRRGIFLFRLEGGLPP